MVFPSYSFGNSGEATVPCGNVLTFSDLGLFFIACDHCLRVGESRPAERCHVKVDNQVEENKYGADHVKGIDVPRKVPEQKIIAEEERCR